MLITVVILVFVVLALWALVAFSLLQQRQARAELLRGLSAGQGETAECKTTKDLLLSQISALDAPLRRSERVSPLQKLLAQADLQIRPRNFLIFCVLGGLLLAGNLFFVGKRNPIFAWVGLLAGFLVPYAYAAYQRNKRFQRFEELFPEAMDSLALAVRAGHTLTAALELISDELTEPVAGEFRLLLREQQSGVPIRHSLINLADRVPLVDVRSFVTAVMLQGETGGNLADILDSLSHVVREHFKNMRVVRVYKAQDRLTMILLMGLPPAIVLVMLLFSRMLHTR